MQPIMQFIFVMSLAILSCHASLKEDQMRCTRDMKDGPCRALINRFFYNMTTGICEKFWYGGCYGNKNNFVDENDCKATCKRCSKISKKCST
uniref:Putative tick kunitz 19 n=1 Tax=Ixodes ricinus TaxID=34613 RepID=V5HAQ9_IXORI